MGELLATRRDSSSRRLRALRGRLTAASDLVADRACVYVTGSFGRGEASPYSDLDAFIVGKVRQPEDSNDPPLRELTRLQEIELQCELIRACRLEGLPDFSGDGEYLKHYTTSELVQNAGRPEDDALNTFTARLLLILESRPLLNEAEYGDFLQAVLAQYWRDYRGHEKAFRPAFLVNDILRLWRTFCVNYEARTQADPPVRKAKRRLKHHKLAHSRLLTCFSMIAGLLAHYVRAGTVSLDDALALCLRSPTERIEDIAADTGDATVAAKAVAVLGLYEQFLSDTDKPERTLLDEFAVSADHEQFTRKAWTFGDGVHELLRSIGRESGLYRLLIV